MGEPSCQKARHFTSPFSEALGFLGEITKYEDCLFSPDSIFC